MKKVGKYLLILLLLLTGLFFIALLFLFFVPNSSLFGITYVGKKTTYYSQSYSPSRFDSITLDSNAFDVNIVPTDLDKVSLKVENKMFGFTLKKHSTVNIQPKLYGKTLTFTVTEPYGAAFVNGSTIELRIPKENTFNLNIKNSSATVNFKAINESSEKSAQYVKLNNLSYTTKKGTLNIAKVNLLGNIDLNLKSGICSVLKTSKLNNNNVTLKQTSGRFTTENGVVLGNITHLTNTTGNVTVHECNNYTAELGSAGGNINLGTTKGLVKISSTDTNVKINSQNANSEINLTKSGSIKIVKALSEDLLTNVKTNNGDIDIGSAAYNILATSVKGNITINNMHKSASINNQKGNITLTYASDAPEHTANQYNRKAEITSGSGKVRVTGIENITLNIDSGYANIVMKEVYGTNTLTAKSGSIKVVTPSNLGVEASKAHKYKLTTHTEDAGTVFVGISACDEYTKKELTTIDVGVTAGSSLGETYINNLTVTATNGSIRVVNEELDH